MKKSSNGSQLDCSYTADFGGEPFSRTPTSSNVPSNLEGPKNLGGQVGQLEGAFPIGFPVAPMELNFENSHIIPSNPSANPQLGSVEKDGGFDSNMAHSL